MTDPGTDQVPEQERQRQNAWLAESERPSATKAKRSPGPRDRRSVSSVLRRLANRLGVPLDELTETIPDETIVRTQFPTIEEAQEDGSVLFKGGPSPTEGYRHTGSL